MRYISWQQYLKEHACFFYLLFKLITKVPDQSLKTIKNIFSSIKIFGNVNTHYMYRFLSSNMVDPRYLICQHSQMIHKINNIQKEKKLCANHNGKTETDVL